MNSFNTVWSDFLVLRSLGEVGSLTLILILLCPLARTIVKDWLKPVQANILAALIITGSASAQSLSHSPISASALPDAGRGMVLAVQVTGSRSPDLDVRALVFRDGIPLDVKLRAKTFDKSDKIVYSATIPAPKTSLTYTFALSKESEVIKTVEYRIIRDCENELKLASWNGVPAEPSREEGMLPVLAQSRALERDIEQYEFVLKQILALKEAFTK